jgi:hypothetical protein
MPLPVVFPDPFDPEDEINAALMNAVANAIYGIAGTPSELYTATFYPDEAQAITGNAIALTLHGSITETYGRQNASAINDEWKHGAFLSADTYTLSIRVIKTNNSGILKIKIDDVVVATFDLYAAADAVSDQTQASIVLTAGWHSVKGLVDSKHASSSGYDANWVKMYLRGASV